MLPFLGRSWIIKACLVLNIATFMDLLGRALFHRAKYLSIKSQRRTCLLQKNISRSWYILFLAPKDFIASKNDTCFHFSPIQNCIYHWYKIYCIYFLMYKSLVLGKQQRLIQPSKNPSSFHRLLGEPSACHKTLWGVWHLTTTARLHDQRLHLTFERRCWDLFPLPSGKLT